MIFLQSTNSLRLEDRTEGDRDDKRNGETPVRRGVRKSIENRQEHQTTPANNSERRRQNIHIDVLVSPIEHAGNSTKVTQIPLSQQSEGEEDESQGGPANEKCFVGCSNVYKIVSAPGYIHGDRPTSYS